MHSNTKKVLSNNFESIHFNIEKKQLIRNFIFYIPELQLSLTEKITHPNIIPIDTLSEKPLSLSYNASHLTPLLIYASTIQSTPHKYVSLFINLLTTIESISKIHAISYITPQQLFINEKTQTIYLCSDNNLLDHSTFIKKCPNYYSAFSPSSPQFENQSQWLNHTLAKTMLDLITLNNLFKQSPHPIQKEINDSFNHLSTQSYAHSHLYNHIKEALNLLLNTLSQKAIHKAKNHLLNTTYSNQYESINSRLKHIHFERTHEEKTLNLYFNKAITKHPSCIFVKGEEKIGKTHLINHFLNTYTLSNAISITLNYQQLFSPMQDISNILSNLEDQLIKLAPEKLNYIQKIFENKFQDQQSLELISILPQLNTLFPRHQLPKNIPYNIYNQLNFSRKLTHFTIEILKIISDVFPIILYFDDLHDAKEDSLFFMEILLYHISELNIFIICTYTKTTHTIQNLYSKLSKHVDMKILQLQALTKSDIQTTLNKLFQTSFNSNETIHYIINHSKGFPLQIKAILQQLYSLHIINFDKESLTWSFNTKKLDSLTSFEWQKKEINLHDIERDTKQILNKISCINIPFNEKTLCSILTDDTLQITKTFSFCKNNDFFIKSEKSKDYVLLKQSIQKQLYDSTNYDIKEKMHKQTLTFLLTENKHDKLTHQFITGFHIQKMFKSYLKSSAINKKSITLLFDCAINTLNWGFYKNSYTHFHNIISIRKKYKEALTDDMLFKSLLYKAVCLYKLNKTKKAEKFFTFLSKLNLSDEHYLLLINEHIKFLNFSSQYSESLNKCKTALKKINKQKLISNTLLLNIQIILDYIYIEFKSKFSKKIQNTPILNNYYDCVAYTIYETIALVGGSKNTLLLTYACVKMAKLSLKYAPSTETSMGFMALGYIHTRTGNFKKAYQYGQQAIKLIDSYTKPENIGNLHFTYTGFFLPWNTPHKDYIQQYNKSFNYCVAEGHQVYASGCKIFKFITQFAMSEPLSTLFDELKHYSLSTAHIQFQQDISHFLRITDALLHSTNTTKPPKIDKNISKTQGFHSFASQSTMNMILEFYRNDYEAAYQTAKNTERKMKDFLQGIFYCEFLFYYALIISKISQKNKKFKFKDKLKYNDILKKYKLLNESCPENFQAKYYLIKANHFKLTKNNDTALTYLFKTIEISIKYKNNAILGLCHEEIMIHYINNNCHHTAYKHLQEAIHYYTQWECFLKLSELKQTYEPLLTQTAYSNHSFIQSRPNIDKILQTLTQETNINTFFLKLLQFMKETTQSDKGYIFIKNENQLDTKVYYTNLSDEITIETKPIEQCHHVAKQIIFFVQNTTKPLNLHNPIMNEFFSFDPHIQENTPQCICCIPIKKEKDILGIIYLETKKAPYPIANETFENIEFAASQSAFAFENASLINEKYELIQTLEDKVKHQVSLIRKAEEEQQKSKEIAKKAAEQSAYGTLTRGIAHEIRNPMAMILSGTELILDNIDNKPKVLEYTKTVKDAIIRLKKITNTMLRYGKPVSDEKRECDVTTILKDTLLVASAECKKRNIKIETNYESTLAIIGDENSLSQAFLNIILNSIQSIDKNGTITISTESCEFYDPNNQKTEGISITILDSGKGIETDSLNKIFDPFYSTKYGNTGLGLSIVLKIITEHKGSIHINSEVNTYTNFTIYLPYPKKIHNRSLILKTSNAEN